MVKNRLCLSGTFLFVNFSFHAIGDCFHGSRRAPWESVPHGVKSTYLGTSTQSYLVK